MQMPSSNWLQLMQLSHLSRRDELQRPEGDLEIGSVGLEIVQSTGNALLQLGGVLPRGAVGGDLVQGGRHGCGFCLFDDGNWVSSGEWTGLVLEGGSRYREKKVRDCVLRGFGTKKSSEN